jgi:fatty acid desaturase
MTGSSLAARAERTRRRSWSLSFGTLKRLSFTHSTIYVILLVVWLVPGLAAGETIFGFAHGLGWIAMVLLIFAALYARVVPLRTAFAVSVLGGIAPFFGSYEFVREERRRAGTAGPPAPAATAAPDR